MIESISKRGYASTTVAHVIGLAGVSRRAFYEQFHNKEECFLATYDIVVARSRKQVLQAWSSERGWDNRLHASYKTLLDDIAADPKGAHLVLIDALGIGVKARERLHLAGAAYERLLAAAFKASPDTAPLPRIASRAIVGGVRHVILNRVRENRVPELRTLADELLDWVESYRTPALSRLNATALKKPPEIPLASAAFLAKDDRRARVLGSVVHLTLDEGYGELTDPQIAQFAGISTEAFHKQFSSKEECFLTAIDEFAKETLTAVEDSIVGASSWTEAVPIAVRTFIHHIVSRPALLQMAFVDLFEVGPGMIGRMTTSIDSFTALLAEGGPEPRRAPQIASEAITGAIWDIVSAYSSGDRMRYLPCLADHIAFIALAPYIGPKDAIDAIEQVRYRPEPEPASTPASEAKPPAGDSRSTSGEAKPVPGGSIPASEPRAASRVRATAESKPASSKATAFESQPAAGKVQPVSGSKSATGPKQASGKPRRTVRGSSAANRSRQRPSQ